MFQHIDIVSQLDDIAEKTLIDVDRKRYYPFFEIVERYISQKKNSIIVSGNTADYMLLDKPIDSEFISYELYCDDAVLHARELAALIYKSDIKITGVDLRLTCVSTRIPNKEIIIKIGDREIVNLRNLPISSGVYIIDVVLVVEKKGLFDKSQAINCISPEHQLIDVYTSLIDPKECSTWSDSIGVEYALRKQLGLINREDSRTPDEKETAGGRRIPAEQIIKTLYDDYVSQPGHVMVGFNPGSELPSRLQTISMYPLEDEESKIKKAVAADPVRIETSINYPHVPTEMKIRRLTGYYVYERIRKVVVDVFDTGTYSLISFNTNDDGIKVGTLFVIAKHLLIDLWTIRYIRKRNQIGDEHYKNMVQKIESDFKALFRDYDSAAGKDPAPTAHSSLLGAKNKVVWNEIFPLNPNKYLGHYEDEDLAVKRMRQKEYEKSTKRYYDYFPYQKDNAKKDELDVE